MRKFLRPLGVIFASLVGYICLFSLAYSSIGPMIGALILLPAVIAAAMLGRMAGLIAALCSFPINIFLYLSFAHFPFVETLYQSGLVFLLTLLIAWIVGSQRDLRILLSAKQTELELANRLSSLGVLAGGVAHEINNPLTLLMSNLEFLGQKLHIHAGELSTELFEQFKQLLTESQQGTERIRRIVRDLRFFSRTETAQYGPIDVERVLDYVLSITQNEIRHRAHMIKQYSAVAAIDGSEGQLSQVFLNLLMNAVQAIPEGNSENNTIRVATKQEGNQVVIEIEDSGKGIPETIQDQIFNPFFTTKPVGQASGLGLSICYTMVKELNGTIVFKSNVNSGTLFRLTFPLSQKQLQPSAPKTTILEKPKSLKRGRVLLIDDDPLVVSALKRTLATEYDVEISTSGKEALEKISEQQNFDVIVSDLMMPQITGMDLYEELQKTAPLQAEKMIFLTGGAFTHRAFDFIKHVKNPCLEKPVKSDVLKKLIQDTMK